MTGVPPQPPQDSDQPPAPGWWKASDHNWYPPETHPNYVAPAAPPVSFTPPPLPAQPVYSLGSAPSQPGYSPGYPPTQPFAMVDTPPMPAKKSPSWLWPAVIAGVVALGLGAAFFVRSRDGGSEVATAPPAATAAPAPTAAAGREPDDSETDAPAPTAEAAAEPTSEARRPASGGSVPFVEGCEAVEVDDFGDVQIAVRFVNPADSPGTVSATFGLRDADDVRVSTGSVFVEAAQPGERVWIEYDTLEQLPSGTELGDLRCEVLEIEPQVFGDPPVVPPGSECAFVELDSFDDIQVELTVTSPFRSRTDLGVTYALRGADGVRFDTSTTFIEAVDAGETIRTADDAFTPFPDWVSEADFSCEIVAVDDFG